MTSRHNPGNGEAEDFAASLILGIFGHLQKDTTMPDDNSYRGPQKKVDTANDPLIHCNRFPPEPAPKQKSEQELRQEKYRRISDATHHLDASSFKGFPTDAKYWGIKSESIHYDSGYGDRGQPDMTTSYYPSISIFDTEEALEAWVLERTERREAYKIIRAEPVKTEVKAVFSVLK